MNDRLEVKKRPIKQLVDYNEVELVDLGHLDRRVLEPQIDDLRGNLAAALQSGTQLLPTGWQDKNTDGVGKDFFDLKGALEVDLVW